MSKLKLTLIQNPYQLWNKLQLLAVYSSNLNNNYKALVCRRNIFTSQANYSSFWEKEKRDGYTKEIKVSQKKLILDGLKELRNEISLWKDEVKLKLENDPIMTYRPGKNSNLINMYAE